MFSAWVCLFVCLLAFTYYTFFLCHNATLLALPGCYAKKCRCPGSYTLRHGALESCRTRQGGTRYVPFSKKAQRPLWDDTRTTFSLCVFFLRY